jgi:hypothetical protein
VTAHETKEQQGLIGLPVTLSPFLGDLRKLERSGKKERVIWPLLLVMGGVEKVARAMGIRVTG